MALHRIFSGLLLALLATMASAAERQFKLDGGETLSINAGTDWIQGKLPENSPYGTVTLHGPDSTIWRLTLMPLPPDPTMSGDPGNLRIYVRNLARAIEDSGSQVNEEQIALEGVAMRGFYFKVHDSRPKPKAQVQEQEMGEYVDGYMGALSVNSKVYLFDVLWNKGGEVAAKNALATLKTARIK